MTLADLDFEAKFSLRVRRDDYVHAFVSYFDVLFSKCHTRTGFTTAPFAEYTHWKQTVFYVDKPLTVSKGTHIKGQLSVKRNAKNPRDLDIFLSSSYNSPKSGMCEQSRHYRMR